jgi:hypothetical protein
VVFLGGFFGWVFFCQPCLHVGGLFDEANQKLADEGLAHVLSHDGHAVLDKVQGEDEQLAGRRAVLRVGGREMLAHHALQHAHEAGDETVDVAGVVDAGRLEHHEGAKEGGGRGGAVLLVAGQALVDDLAHSGIQLFQLLVFASFKHGNELTETSSCKHWMKRVQISTFLQCFADRNLKISNNIIIKNSQVWTLTSTIYKFLLFDIN